MSRFIRLLCLPALCVVAAVVVLLLRARRPRDAEAYFERGTALLNASQYAEACEKYARAVEIDERFGDAYFNWGVALARMGKRAEADEEWKKAAELNPEVRPQIEAIRKQLRGKE